MHGVHRTRRALIMNYCFTQMENNMEEKYENKDVENTTVSEQSDVTNPKTKKDEKKSETIEAIIALACSIGGLFVLGLILGLTAIYSFKNLIKSDRIGIKIIAIIALLIGIVDVVGSLAHRFIR